MRTRKTQTLSIATLGALALTFQGCGDDTEYCVDRMNRVVDNNNCYDADDAGDYNSGFFWARGGSHSGSKIARGTRITGGDRVPAVAGGFGSSARSSGIGRSVPKSSSGGS